MLMIPFFPLGLPYAKSPVPGQRCTVHTFVGKLSPRAGHRLSATSDLVPNLSCTELNEKIIDTIYLYYKRLCSQVIVNLLKAASMVLALLEWSAWPRTPTTSDVRLDGRAFCQTRSMSRIPACMVLRVTFVT